MKSISELFKLIPQSVFDKFNKVSSVRIQALLTFGIIGLFALVFLGIEISAAVVALIATGKYVLSGQIIGIFAALLAHHLGLLFNKRKEYNKDETIDTAPAMPNIPGFPVEEEIKDKIKVIPTIELKKETKEQDLG